MKIAKPFYEGLKRNTLLLPWCKSCGKPHFYPRAACPHCWSEDYDWRPAKGTGTLHSFTIVRANPPTSFAASLPYTIAIIDLDEGVRILSNIVGDAAGLAIGDKVGVEFVTRGGEQLPMFKRLK